MELLQFSQLLISHHHLILRVELLSWLVLCLFVQKSNTNKNKFLKLSHKQKFLKVLQKRKRAVLCREGPPFLMSRYGNNNNINIAAQKSRDFCDKESTPTEEGERVGKIIVVEWVEWWRRETREERNRVETSGSTDTEREMRVKRTVRWPKSRMGVELIPLGCFIDL